MLLGEAIDILLVEDDPMDAELALASLKRRNLNDKVIHFLDGDEALDFVAANIWSATWKAEEAPKLILIDLKLVRMGGLEVLRQLKVRDRTRPIPVVIFTASQNEAEILESYRLGANSYIVKPADAERYAQVVGDIAYYWLVVNRSFNSPPISPVER